MSAQTAPDRWQEIRGIHREYRFFYQIGSGLLLVVIGVLIGGALFSSDPGYKTNLYTEVLSIAVTVFILNLLAEQREERRRIRDLQERLIMEARSSSNETAKRAIDELRHQGWLTGEGGLLKQKNLMRANLSKAYLMEVNFKEARLNDANLQAANLEFANLQGAWLIGVNLKEAGLGSANLHAAILDYANLQRADLNIANLEEAKLPDTKLQGTRLAFANLQGAVLEDANLQKANLAFAKLQGANFFESDLREAYFDQAQFDEHTILPDGGNWTPDTDLSRFTDPNHPNAWRSKSWDAPRHGSESNTEGGE